MTHITPIQLYEVCLDSEVTFVLASSSERAAWAALELSMDSGKTLSNVKLADEW